MAGLTRRQSLILGAAGLGLFPAVMQAEVVSQTEAVTTQDSFPIKFTYYPASRKRTTTTCHRPVS